MTTIRRNALSGIAAAALIGGLVAGAGPAQASDGPEAKIVYPPTCKAYHKDTKFWAKCFRGGSSDFLVRAVAACIRSTGEYREYGEWVKMKKLTERNKTIKGSWCAQHLTKAMVQVKQI